MASTRAPAVAEVLWELKRVDKVASFSAVADRAGFSAGANGRAMVTCLKTIRKDWPHLQWWRAIRDDGTVKKDGDQEAALKDWGAEFEPADDAERVSVMIDESRMMVWDADESGSSAVASSSQAE